MDDREEARRALDEWINSSFDMDAYNFAREYKGTAMHALARGFCAAWRIRAEAKAEALMEAADSFWKELHEEAEKQYDKRLELLGPIETSDDAAFRKTLHDGWSAWLLAKRIIVNRRAAILADHTPDHTADAGKRAEDVETVREALTRLAYPTIILCKPARVINLDDALAALDRIAGKEE